ncbi:hypothetical protein MD484_g5984, partial [Candolleomyces efflorescens]
MPSTRRNRTRALLKSSAPYIASSVSASASSSPLRPGSEESDADDIRIIDVTKVVSWQDLRQRTELDDPVDYKFQDTILTADYYQVQFGTNGKLRKYFAPLNGEMKPDDRHVREMLLAGGWISSSDSEDVRFSSRFPWTIDQPNYVWYGKFTPSPTCTPRYDFVTLLGASSAY